MAATIFRVAPHAASMAYELSIPLTRATLELEFETVAELERKLARLDVARIERAVEDALSGQGAGTKAPARKKSAKKRPSSKKGGAAKRPAAKRAAKARQ